MRKLSIFLFAVLLGTNLISLNPSGALARTVAQDSQVFTHAEAGIEFTLPKGWKGKPDGAVITVGPADESIQMLFWVPDEDTFDETVKGLDKELSKTIKNTKVTNKGKSDTHNGMPHYGEGGTGDVDGTTIEWSVDVLGAKKPVIILTFAAPELFEKHGNEYLSLVRSIKKSE